MPKKFPIIILIHTQVILNTQKSAIQTIKLKISIKKPTNLHLHQTLKILNNENCPS